MRIEIEYLDEQITGLIKQQQPLMAQMNMLTGAIQALEALKTKLLEEEKLKEKFKKEGVY
jgi:prefoldin subunit 5